MGDRLADVTGVIGYSFGNYEVNVTESVVIQRASRLRPERTRLRARRNRQLSIASCNILNFTVANEEASEPQNTPLGDHIAVNLRAPDIVALQEVQDNDGQDAGDFDACSDVRDADETIEFLIDEVVAACGPRYDYFQVSPTAANEFGGAPCGNIRNVTLYDPHRISLQACEDARSAQALANNAIVDDLLAADPKAKVVVLGDLNTFEFSDVLTEDLPGTDAERVLTSLIPQAVRRREAYTFIFDGNSQVLDHDSEDD